MYRVGRRRRPGGHRLLKPGRLHLDPFRTEPQVLRAFLAGYGWPATDDFPRRAMSAALRHQFDLFVSVRDRLPLDQFRTLDELARRLWDAAR